MGYWCVGLSGLENYEIKVLMRLNIPISQYQSEYIGIPDDLHMIPMWLENDLNVTWMWFEYFWMSPEYTWMYPEWTWM